MILDPLLLLILTLEYMVRKFGGRGRGILLFYVTIRRLVIGLKTQQTISCCQII